MTTPTDFIDEALGAYGSYLTGYNDHQGRYDPIDLETAKAALHEGIEALVLEVIGGEEHENPDDYPFTYGQQAGRNELRAEQRKRLAALLKKEEGKV